MVVPQFFYVPVNLPEWQMRDIVRESESPS